MQYFADWMVFLALMLGALPGASAAQASPPGNIQHTQAVEDSRESQVSYHLPPDKLEKARALYKIRTILYLFGLVLGILILWIVLEFRIAPFFRTVTERTTRNRFLQSVVFVPFLLALLAATALPLDLYEHHISRSYGLSVQTWASWMGDWLKEEAVSLAVSTLAVFALFLLIRKSPQRWWFYFWLLSIPFLVLLIFVAPVILDPMFNRFEPLEANQPQLVAAIEQVTQRGGLKIPRDRMFLMKASDKVTTYNAYVTGIGPTKRVVVWDNTARDMTVPETLFVFGHEMGHYVLNHIYKGLAFFAGMSLFGFWVGRKIAFAMLARWRERWQIRGIDDLAALPVLILVVSLLAMAGEPIGNAFSRYQEHQADIYGLEVTHGLFPGSSQVAASAFQKLGEKSYDYPTPDPLLVFWSYSHPSIAARIQFALSYDPWSRLKTPRFLGKAPDTK